jgi:hypothetical protein
MTTALYEITNARLALDSVVNEAEGELTPQWEAAFDRIDGDWTEKAERCALWIREQLATAELVKAEEDRLAARRKALVRNAEGLTAYLQRNMEAIGKQKVNGLLVTLAIQKNPPRVEAVTPMDEPELRNIATFCPQYVNHVESWTLNKRAILDDAKAGTLPEDILRRVAIVQNTSLRIR